MLGEASSAVDNGMHTRSYRVGNRFERRIVSFEPKNAVPSISIDADMEIVEAVNGHPQRLWRLSTDGHGEYIVPGIIFF